MNDIFFPVSLHIPPGGAQLCECWFINPRNQEITSLYPPYTQDFLKFLAPKHSAINLENTTGWGPPVMSVGL